MRPCVGVCAVALACSSPRGEALFYGRGAELTGRLTGNDAVLPLDATRCSNCHVAGPASARGDAGNAFGPALNRATLTVATARHGGPATRFDSSGFCRLLREGIDSGDIIIARAMPRYTMSDADCHLLWEYLSTLSS